MTKVIGSALPNIPWQERKEGDNAPVWRFEKNPIIGRDGNKHSNRMYRSELTNEWLDESLKNQRPIAAMVDNEKTALPHYGLSTAGNVIMFLLIGILAFPLRRFLSLKEEKRDSRYINDRRDRNPFPYIYRCYRKKSKINISKPIVAFFQHDSLEFR